MGFQFFPLGIFLTQGLNSCPLHHLNYQEDSLPPHYLGSCREPAYCILGAYCILSAALSTASSFRIWNSSTGILSLPGASVRNPAHDKGHEEEGSAYAKAGSSLRSLPGNSRAIYPQNQSLPTFCFVLSPTPLIYGGLSPTTPL